MVLVIKRPTPVSGIAPKYRSFKTQLDPIVLLDENTTGIDYSNATTGQRVARPWLMYDPKAKIYRCYFFANVSEKTKIYMSTSRDTVGWGSASLVLDVSPSGWDANRVESPSVVYDEDTDKFYMFYCGAPGLSGSGFDIGVAESNDGINFTKYANNPILTDPEGTNWLRGVSVAKVRDDWYLMAYNGNGYNLIWKATNFPYEWQQVGKLENKLFHIYGSCLLYDEEIDKVLVFANTYYPPGTPPSEPIQTGRISLFIGDDPLSLTFIGNLLEVPVEGKNPFLRKMMKNLFGLSAIKIGDKYRMLFNAGSIDDGLERMFGAWVGADTGVHYQINFEKHDQTADFGGTFLKLGIGTRAILKSATLYAFEGTPTEMSIRTVKSEGGSNYYEVIWHGKESIQEVGEVEIMGDRDLGYVVKGANSSNVVSVAGTIIVEILPEIDFMTFL